MPTWAKAALDTWLDLARITEGCGFHWLCMVAGWTARA
jgi:hypothetical protein